MSLIMLSHIPSSMVGFQDLTHSKQRGASKTENTEESSTIVAELPSGAIVTAAAGSAKKSFRSIRIVACANEKGNRTKPNNKMNAILFPIVLPPLLMLIDSFTKRSHFPA